MRQALSVCHKLAQNYGKVFTVNTEEVDDA